MALVPRCTECSEPLLNEDGSRKPPGTRTCGKVCRQKRARRIKRERSEQSRENATLPPGMAEVSAVVTAGAQDAAHDVLKEELRPIVREAMTGDVLRGINTLVGLTPRAIQLLELQMESGDEQIAQRAVTLLLKYTMGNPSVAPPPTHQAPTGLTVMLGIPRAEGPGDATAPEVLDATALRTCGDCDEAKPEGEFAGAAPRCRECSGKLKGLLTERFGDAYQA